MDDNAEEGARATIPPPIISSFFKQNDSFFLFESRTVFFLKAEHFWETASKERRAAGFPGVA